MRVLGVAKLFMTFGIWRLTRIEALGRTVVKTLVSPDETIRTVAGMLLVKAGKLAEPPLKEALAKRESLPTVLVILGDIGDKRTEPDIRNFSADRDPDVAQAARDALRTMGAS